MEVRYGQNFLQTSQRYCTDHDVDSCKFEHPGRTTAASGNRFGVLSGGGGSLMGTFIALYCIVLTLAPSCDLRYLYLVHAHCYETDILGYGHKPNA